MGQMVFLFAGVVLSIHSLVFLACLTVLDKAGNIIIDLWPVHTVSGPHLGFFNSLVANVELVQYIPPHALGDDHLEALEQKAVFYSKCITERPERPDGTW